YPSVLGVLAMDVWLDQHELKNWHAPACLDWEDRPVTVLIAAAGRFDHDGTVDELLVRLGAVSVYASIEYWSWSRKRWRPMFERSVALSVPIRTAVRQDFRADELLPGDRVLVLQDESGPVDEIIMRFSIVDRTTDRIEIAVTNVTPARIALLTLFEPGGSDMRLSIERESEGRWTYYSLTRLSGSTLLARTALERSYANRAEAMFRYLAGAERQQGAAMTFALCPHGLLRRRGTGRCSIRSDRKPISGIRRSREIWSSGATTTKDSRMVNEGASC
ncbi:MAG: DUF6675 family protein, partial [Hyphomicrobiales bacterium]